MKIGIRQLATRLRSGAQLTLSALAMSWLAIGALQAQQVGTNVNMVTGTQWPGGDPFLQRQNEPSMAISSRNPLHMVAGANDYRTVDLPGVSGAAEPTGDAWLGFFTSYDGGQTWTSTLVPGYPQDTSVQGKFSPLYGLNAGADPTVRAGTNGLFYYGGLAFNRGVGGTSKVFVATYTDDNNLEGGNTVRYLWTTIVENGTSNLFEDKPSIAVDIPRSWSGFCVVPAVPLVETQTFRAGTVYAAWTQFTGGESSNNAAIWFSHSLDCGRNWTQPKQISGTAMTNQGAALAIDPNTGALYVAWRVFASTNPTQTDAIMYAASFDGGTTFTKAALVANITPFDQGETSESFRTNDYPTIAVDAASRVYVAWSQRGVGNVSTTGGDARIVVATGIPTAKPKNVPLQWGTPVAVDPFSSRGHQIVPAIAFSAGKLTVAWYDLRDDDLLAIYTPLGLAGEFSDTLENDGGAPDFPAFGTYIQDPAPPYSSDARRQTLDVRSAQALPGNPPTFLPSVQVSDYPYGSVPASTEIQQLAVDPPNLPMFQSGTLPFFGDYIDIAGPTFIANPDGSWRFNNQATDPDFTHVVWTDNRDVVPPADGNWANYVPPTYGTSTTSIFDPTQQRPACTQSTTGNTGDRNQNIYTAQLAPGVVLSAPGNAKPLGTGTNGQLIQRQFPIVVANTTAQTRYYQLTVASQPAGGAASFLQMPIAGQPYPLAQIEVQVPPLSSTSRGIFVTSTSLHATVTIDAAELTAINGSIVPGGETGSVTINGDPNNPPSADPNIANDESYTPTIANPNIANPNIANPNIANPNIANPNIANPNIANPNIANPNIANPNIANPNIANPNIANPNIANTDLSDGTITDGTWAVTNTGNTSSGYNVSLTGQNPPAGVTLQLIVYQNYTTPLAQGCTLSQQSHFVPVANITNVTFSTLQQLLQPAADNPSQPALALAPGQTAYITLRAIDSTTNNPALALAHYNPITQASPVAVSQGSNTGTTQPPATLTILTKMLPPADAGHLYTQSIAATGGTGALTFTAVTVDGVTLSSTGQFSGNPTSTGSYPFTAVVTDTLNVSTSQALTLTVNAAPAITTTVLPATDLGLPYAQTIMATGGTGSLTFTTVTIDGVTLSSTGQFLGNPTYSGSYPFTAIVTDTLNVSASQSLILTVNAAPSITTTVLPAADAGHLYTQSIAATGGTGALTFTAVTVDVVTLSSTGLFSGNPTSTGSYPFTAVVTDTLGESASMTLTLQVNPSPVILPASLPAATQYVAYAQPFSVSAGTGTAPFVWSAPTLPSFLTFNTTTLVLSGTATVSGSFPVTIKVTDANGVSASSSYLLVVNGAGPAIGTSSLPNGEYNAPYTPQTLSANSGTAPYRWSLGSGGVLPAGMNLSASGTISGTPGQAGVWSIPITVTDANSLTANATLSLTVGLATGYASSSTCYMPYPTTPMYYLGSGAPGTWSVIAPGALSGQLTILPAATARVAGYVNTNGTAVTWASNTGGQNDQFVTSATPFSIQINNGSYVVASVNSSTSLTLTQSAGVHSYVPYSYTIPAGGNQLAGCLSGDVSSGSYALQFTAGTSTFSLPLQVVGQDVQDNGTVNVNSSGIGADVPPNGFQEGVVTPGQSFSFLPGYYAGDEGFSGNALMGFAGSAPQLCGSVGNLPNSLTAPQAGRFDIALDGTTQGCAPIPAFPTSPAPIVFESVDAVTSSTSWGAVTITNVVLSSSNSNAFAGARSVLEIEAGGTNPNPVSVALNYFVNNTGCPGCINQVQIGLNTDASPQTYVFWGGEYGSGSSRVNINVPNTPGRYYIAIDFAEDYGFLYSSPYWSSGQPTAPRYIGVVDVW